MIKITVDAIQNLANETENGGVVIGGGVHEAVGPELLDKCWNLNSCETVEHNVTLG